MRTRNVVAIATILLTLISLSAQEPKHKLIGIETDPISTLFGARTISVLLEPENPGHWSLFLNVVTADFPDWMDDLLNPKNKDKGFNTEISVGGGFAVDYFLKEEREGTYVGLINLFFNNRVMSGGFQESVQTHNIIPRLGYRWFPFKKKTFYLNPFVGFRYEYILDGITTINNQNFKAAGLQPFGTLHIGIKL